MVHIACRADQASFGDGEVMSFDCITQSSSIYF